MKQDMIVILDLGSEENPRLAREIRALGVYSEIYPHDITLEQLKAFRDSVNDGKSYQGQYIQLTADIDLGNEAWTPIGTEGKPFRGPSTAVITPSPISILRRGSAIRCPTATSDSLG